MSKPSSTSIRYMSGSTLGGMHMSASIQPTNSPRDSMMPRLKAEASPRVPTRRITFTLGSSRAAATDHVRSGESSSTTMISISAGLRRSSSVMVNGVSRP